MVVSLLLMVTVLTSKLQGGDTAKAPPHVSRQDIQAVLSTDHYVVDIYKNGPAGHGDPLVRLLLAADRSADPEAVAAELAREFQLSPPVSDTLVAAIVANELLQRDTNSDAKLPGIEELFLKAVADSNYNVHTVAAAYRFYEGHAEFELSHSGYHEIGLKLIRSSPDPGATALAVGRFDPDRNRDLLSIALETYSDNPAVLQAVADSYPTRYLPLVRHAVVSEIERDIGNRYPSLPARVRALIAEEAIETDLDLGSARDAILRFEQLSRDAELEVRTGDTTEVDSAFGTLEFHGQLHDIRADLAAAYRALGQVEKSEQIAKTISSAAAKSPDAKTEIEMRMSLLTRLAMPGDPGDPFDFLSQAALAALGHSATENPFSSPVWKSELSELALRSQYPELAAQLLEASAAGLRRSLSVLPDGPTLPAAVLAARGSSTALATASAAALESQALKIRSSLPHDTREDQVAETIRRNLALPKIAPFVERALPPGIPTGDVDEPCDETADNDLSFPNGFHPLRVDRNGNQIAAVAVSQDLDPLGEVSRGAYWLIRSEDGGKTWIGPFYTGLRENFPYVVISRSELPLIIGDRFLLEVMVHEVDQSTITFPPVGIQAVRTQRGLYLEIPFADLERDSDGDGITDLEEERLMTDPFDPDTDHDGIPDGRDPLPNVPLSQSSDDISEIATAVLNRVSGAGSWAIIEGLQNSDKRGEYCRTRPSDTDHQTMFLVGDRRMFGALDTKVRTIVLTESEHVAAEKKFGPIYAGRFRVFLVSRDRTRATIDWDGTWQGPAIQSRRSTAIG